MSGFKDHFSSHASAYSTYRPGYPDALATWLAAEAPTRSLAVDVGCGSGQLSTLLAERFAQVVALDPSAEQIANAQPHPNVDYRVARAEQTGIAPRSADLLTAAQAAHWFDLPAFFAEAQRVLKPAGLIALVTYAGMTPGSDVAAIVETFRTETLAPYWPSERAMVDNDYRDIHLPFAPVEAPPMLLEVQWSLEALIGYVDTWSAVRAMERAIGRAPFEQMVARLREAWGPAEATKLLQWPLTVIAGRAT
ncbi:class I SAM-dependent methyltransferase [Rhizorhabdus sp. FW153]|uniref:class I SAM-dependent methyltransferase n=1 Tax=Rhizorhabdus sp. FW153 TaxID=3400216 RepID=UPI003CE743F4